VAVVCHDFDDLVEDQIVDYPDIGVACSLGISYSMVDDSGTSGPGDILYTWRIPLTNKLNLETLDMDVPMFSKGEGAFGFPNTMCKLTGTPPIHIRAIPP
jgi:hypothetical protein